MARKCALTGKKPSFGSNVSFSKRHTKRRWNPNVQYHRIYVPELDQFVRLKLSARALRTIEKKGLMKALRDEGLTLNEVMGGKKALAEA